MRRNSFIHQIGEHGFEPLISHRLFDAVDGAFDAAACVRPSWHNHKAVKIDCIDLTQLVDEEELVLAYRMASSNIRCRSTIRGSRQDCSLVVSLTL